MKKLKYILAITCFAFSFAEAQVGINTIDPQQTVHVGGSNSSVQIDGLNATNNTQNVGASGTTRVFVDADGDLTLGSARTNVEILVDTDNYLEDVENSMKISGLL